MTLSAQEITKLIKKKYQMLSLKLMILEVTTITITLKLFLRNLKVYQNLNSTKWFMKQ